MPLEKSIIKASHASSSTFDYKARDLSTEIPTVAKDFVATDAFRSPDFKISDLVAQQVGISRLESDALQGKINAQVLERLKEVQEKAYKEGYDLGLIEGTEKSFQENQVALTERLALMEVQLKRIEELKTHLLVDNEAALVKLVFQIAKKMAMRDLEEHRDAVWEILKDVMSEMQADERIVVKLAAEDLFFLEGLQDKSGKKIESLERVKFVTDDTIKPGGCMIETEFGNVNATVEERVERVWQTLQSRMPRKPQEPQG